MPRGGDRRSKPTKLKLLEGNPGRRPINENEPEPASDNIRQPQGLDRFGKQAWNQLVPDLDQLGLLTNVDVFVLAAFCDAYSQWRHASKALRKLNPIDEEYRKVAITVEKARNEMRLTASEFGLSPAARSRLHVSSKQDDADPFEDFMSQGKRSS